MLTPFTEDNIEYITFGTQPYRYYSSNSSGVVSGNISVLPVGSERQKKIILYDTGSINADSDPKFILNLAKRNFENGNVQSYINQYFGLIHNLPKDERLNKQMSIERITPGVEFNQNFMIKSLIKNCLYPYYRNERETYQYGFTNYNCLNFVSSTVTNSVLLYPHSVSINSTNNSISGSYLPSGSFTFDFWIKPTFKSNGYNPGTIYHVSSCYAISLISGSQKDQNNNCSHFRILAQFASGANYLPSQINTSSLPPNVFLSDDNSLEWNKWHHISIRWGTNTYNNGSGSILINKESKGNLYINSSSILPSNFFPLSKSNPNILCVGNFYDGINSGSNSQYNFFTTDTYTNEGLKELIVDTGFKPNGSFNFNFPLNAEISELKIYNKLLTNQEIESNFNSGPVNLDNLMFYLPVFFIEDSPLRYYYQTPFYNFYGRTRTPFSAELAFNLGGHYINLENYVKDFVTKENPRLWELSGSTISITVSIPQTVDELLYTTASIVKRSFTILPNDNGIFNPNFNLLNDYSGSFYVNDLKNKDLSHVDLNNILTTESVYRGITSRSFDQNLIGPIPTLTSSFTRAPKSLPTVLQRTQDGSSNQVVFFNISNLYYGRRITPKTFIMNGNISGSNISICLKDDGDGNLYRANTFSSQSFWNSIGNIFYEEGLILIKNPSLFFYGKTDFNIEFKGENNIHSMKFNLIAKPYENISSSNPTYINGLSASNNINNGNNEFAYISDIYIHDNNLNVVGKATISQPIIIKDGERIKFSFSHDW